MTPRSILCIEQNLEADSQARVMPDPLHGKKDTWHETHPIVRIVADREALSRSAQDDFLMRDQSGKADRVDRDAVHHCASGAGNHFVAFFDRLRRRTDARDLVRGP